MKETQCETQSSLGQLLVVDDDLVQRSLIGMVGAKLGYDATVASSFEEVALLLQRNKFAVMTLDLSLGDRDGIDIMHLIAERRLQAMPIVIVSGLDERLRNSAKRIAEALGLNVSACLEKPLKLADLRKALCMIAPGHVTGETPAREPDLDGEAVRNALAAGEFFVEFQPKIELETGLPVSAEALARWNSPALGRVSPAVFIPRVEELGLMAELTDHIVDEAVAKGRHLIASHPGFTIAVNVSGSLMSDLELPDRIEAILHRHNVLPKSLIVEVTESVAMSDVERAADILLRLRVKGISTALDDFGTGYSSLSALAHLPFSELKVDQSFVKTCHSDPDMMKIVDACIGLGKRFGLKVVAEGIDQPEVLALLRKAGCDLGQGFLFSPALDSDRAQVWIEVASKGVRRPSRAA